MSVPLKFSKAKKSQAKLRMAISGPSGAGKTYSALAVATNLGKKVAVIDTEHSSASKYADQFSFDALNLESYSPDMYTEALKVAAAEGYDVVVIDSLSHAWFGKDGALELADKAAKRGGNKFTSWKEVTPIHNRMIETILASPFHIIATMRSKTEYVIEEDERGRKVPKKVGLQAIQKDGMEFEFDVAGEMNQENDFVVTKTRCSNLNSAVIKKPGKDLAEILGKWLSDGEPEAPKPQVTVKAEGPDILVAVDTDTPEHWLTRIGNCTSLPELELEGQMLRTLSTGLQKQLYEPYKKKKQELQQQGA